MRFVSVVGAVALTTLIACLGAPKPVITGDPQEVGVAWVDVVFQLQPRDLGEGIYAENGRTIGAVLVRASDLQEFPGVIYDDRFVVFAGLPPGTYAVVAVMGARDYSRSEVLEMYDCGGDKGPCPMAMEVDVILEPAERHILTVDVVPGGIRYLGTVRYDVIRQPPYHDIRKSPFEDQYVDYLSHDSDRSRPQVTDEPEHEYRALYLLTDQLGDGPWEDQFRGRRKQLWESLQRGGTRFSL